MKKQCIKTFKQIYKDKETQQEKSFLYHMIIVRDTEDYQYHLLNVDSMSLWKNYRFKTFKEAELFLNKHPHYINRKVD